MASESHRRYLLTYAMPRNAMPRNAIPQMMTPNDESRVNALRVDSLLTSYIDTQFLLIECRLNNLKKKISTSAWNVDDQKEVNMLCGMFYSVQDLIEKDEPLVSKNAARTKRVRSLLAAVIQVLIEKTPVDRENAPDVRPQAENARQNLRVADRNQISPKAEEPPQRDPFPSILLDSQDNRYRKPLHPHRADHSEKEKAVVAELEANLTRRNEAKALPSGPPTEACFQTLNPYVV